jgi:hypothetical protein
VTTITTPAQHFVQAQRAHPDAIQQVTGIEQQAAWGSSSDRYTERGVDAETAGGLGRTAMAIYDLEAALNT